MAMASGNSLKSRSIQRNNYKILWYPMSVFWWTIWWILATDEHLFWHMHSMLLFLIFYWCNWTNTAHSSLILLVLSYISVFYHFFPVYESRVILRSHLYTKKEIDVFNPSVLDPNNPIDHAKIEMKHKNYMVMAFITMAFKNIAMNHINKCKSSDWSNGLAWKLFEDLRKLI